MDDAFLLVLDVDLNKHNKLSELETSGLVALMQDYNYDTKQTAEALHISEERLLTIINENQLAISLHQP